jgi:transcriptional regulator with XRE-family HTH domain
MPPRSRVELGQALRALRTVGLRGLEEIQERTGAQVVLSRAQLSRYERGECLPPLQYAEHLDGLYDGRGWVEIAIRSLWRSKWDPWSKEHGSAGRFSVIAWPAEYAGIVWIKLKPEPESAGNQFAVKIDWGPWVREVCCRIDEHGIVLMTGKAADVNRVAVSMNIAADKPLYTLNGVGGNLPDDEVIDIQRGWAQIE